MALLIVVAACASLRAPFTPQRYHRTTAIAEAESVDFTDCGDCHDDIQDRAPIPSYHEDCESCHGPGSLHVESEEPTDIRFPASSDCTACHENGQTSHLAWSTGEHERAGVICADCHNPHNRQPGHLRPGRPVGFGQLDATSTLCAQCHVEVASRLNFPSHHPVREGMLSCTDCHDPHGDRRTTLGSSAQRCGGCHQDHEGPWIFEHAPVAEDCTSCHNPHGSASRNLLDTSEPALCLSCHTVPGSHAPGDTYYTRCTDCHGAIHGSYQDAVLREK
jgi:DmsE family decaheme c-type cytochrome